MMLTTMISLAKYNIDQLLGLGNNIGLNKTYLFMAQIKYEKIKSSTMSSK